MNVPLLDLQPQYRSIKEEVDRAVADVVESQRFILGEPVEALERAMAERVGVPHAIGCASGTDALLLSLQGLQLERGAEVVVPAFTFFATAGAVWNAGLTPVFADIDPATYNVTASTIAEAATDRTAAVIVVHLFGQMAEMGPILDLAVERGWSVIEDAAQAIDARQQVGGVWRKAGSLGDTGAFSFFPTKNLGGYGDGGLVTATDAGIADRVSKLRVHGGRQMYHHEMVGTNSRLDALQAAVLNVKLKHLDRWTEQRRANAARYDAAWGDVPGLTTPTVQGNNFHVYNQYTVRVEDRDGVRDRLDAAGVGYGIYYPVALHLQPCFAELGYREGSLPEAERATREVLSLPIFPELTEGQQDIVIETILNYLTG